MTYRHRNAPFHIRFIKKMNYFAATKKSPPDKIGRHPPSEKAVSAAGSYDRDVTLVG